MKVLSAVDVTPLLDKLNNKGIHFRFLLTSRYFQTQRYFFFSFLKLII